MDQAVIVALLFCGAAALYSSVGHAGASAYLAVMALVGMDPTVMRPTALVLNIVVASLVVARFASARHLPLRSLIPFVVGSVPFAFVGGSVVVPGDVYRPLVGAVLLAAALRLWVTADRQHEPPLRVPTVPAIAVGSVIGFMSGLTGTGGGIFLTPLILFFSWAPARAAAGISAGFILLNSVAGLAGNVASVGVIPPALAIWVPAVVAGGVVGSELGARRFDPVALRRALGLVLVIAGLKLILIG
jgi:uncharacterized protein